MHEIKQIVSELSYLRGRSRIGRIQIREELAHEAAGGSPPSSSFSATVVGDRMKEPFGETDTTTRLPSPSAGRVVHYN